MKRAFTALALAVMTSAAFAQTPAIREITVGTAVPSGQDFVTTLDECNIDLAYAEWAGSLPGAWKTVATREQFRSLVRDVVSRKLAAAFPSGPPPPAESNMKIGIKVTFGKSPEIDITIGC